MPVMVLYGIVDRKGIHVLLIQEGIVFTSSFGGTDLFQVRDPFLYAGTSCRLFHGMEVPLICGHAVIDEA